MEIIKADGEEQMEIVRELFREYQAFLGEDLCFQGFDSELAGLPGKYAEPEGAILLAKDNVDYAGCVGVRFLQDGVCEMKRLYVRDSFRGQSVGRDLAVAIIEEAKRLGYQKMQLDTLERLVPALKLYQQLGFYPIKPYYANPLDQVVYLELDLG